MTRVSYFPYTLFPRSTIGSVGTSAPRSGALLRFEDPPGCYGYSDCFPWPELGDAPLETQLTLLKNGILPPQRYPLTFLSSFSLAIPPSHALVTDVKQLSVSLLESLAGQGFTHIKIKVGSDQLKILLELAEVFQRLRMKIRLDFNACLTADEADRVMSELLPLQSSVDFIEDPCPFDPVIWEALQNRWKVRLALDRIPSDFDQQFNLSELRGAVSVLIIKPAIQNPDVMMNWAGRMGVPVVVTSYLDHPLGQLCAAWTAARLAAQFPNQVETCGLLSHTAYEPNAFSKFLKVERTVLVPPSGTWLGMEQALAELEWREISS